MEKNTLNRVFALIIILTGISSAQYTLEDAFPNLTFQRAVDLQHAGDLTDRLFVIDQVGVIKVFQNDASTNSTSNFLDITDRVVYGGERGLLGLAFHPDYEVNGLFFVNYTTPSPLRTRISRFSVSQTNPDSADENSEMILLEYNQPYTNHNGGQLAFGKDGYLYIASGDGGSGGDPQDNSQNISVLLGKILRIDVNNTQHPLNYGIPADNPFVDSIGTVRKEIFAWGLRNPWRFSIDPVTDLIWCADLGQDNWEEIDLIESGKNYGWRCYEGNHEYNLTGCNGIYEFPIWEYSHSVGFSITGGYVYRGPNQPGLVGKYIYADYVFARVWSLEYDGINPTVNNLLFTAPGPVTSFGVDQNQELYILSFNGKIYRITPTSPIVAPSYLRIGSTLNGEINLLWKDNSNNESGFIIERQIGTSAAFFIIDSVDANVTSFSDVVSDTGLYTYRIRGYDVSNQSGYSNEASINVSIIPVELTSFIAELNSGKVNLLWKTASELNNAGFEIERKNINQEWESIGFVVGNGTTTESQSYSFVDQTVSKAPSPISYRLKQIDFDGTFEYSNEVSIVIIALNDFILYQNYPNPFNPTTKIGFQLPKQTYVKISIINSLGEIVKTIVNELKQAGIYNIEFNGVDLPSGIYFYQISTPEYSNTKKMILLK